MARDFQDMEVPANSPSKTRGGGAQAPGALKLASSKESPAVTNVKGSIDAPALTGTPSYPRGGIAQSNPPAKDAQSGNALSNGDVKGSIDAPALTGTPSYPRGGISRCNPPAKDAQSGDALSNGDVKGSIDAPALKGTPSYPRGGIAQSNPPANAPISQCTSKSKGHQVMNCPEMKFLRRKLRNHGTTAESSLWKLLKGKQIAGLQFRRQFSVGDYILDFYCPALKLAIELDGDYHCHMVMPDRDWKRDRVLFEKFGIKTLRFENIIVFNHPESIRDSILKELNAKATEM